ncbi:MAG TPA: hypothetical protein VGG14_14775 [Candidatus Sulfotelmatobacter sp.]|jgi:hypothetical protein
MLQRICLGIAFVCLVAVTLCAADDPFSGKWKLNQEKSKTSGEITKIESLGNNKYKWTSGTVSETITTDGTDQPTPFGKTIAITPEGANDWKMVIKQDGKVLSSMTHSISADGKTQTIKGTDMKPDGTTSDFNVELKRVGTGTGFAGTWVSAAEKETAPSDWEISSYEGDGLTFNNPAYQDVISLKFDGKDYEEKGPTVAPGSTSSGKRVDARTLELTDKVKGKVMDQAKFELSSDGKTLTLTIHDTGQPKAITFVYDKM